MIGSTLLKTLRAIIAILLMELARVANLKPRAGAAQPKERNSTFNLVMRDQKATAFSKGQQLMHQTSTTSFKDLEILDLGKPSAPGANMLHCTARHCTALHYTALHFIAHPINELN